MIVFQFKHVKPNNLAIYLSMCGLQASTDRATLEGILSHIIECPKY